MRLFKYRKIARLRRMHYRGAGDRRATPRTVLDYIGAKCGCHMDGSFAKWVPMGNLILNCDLGEHESVAQTERLMALIDAANICCGVHAGSEAKLRSTLELAKRHGVLVGAHPGLVVAGGRGATNPSVAAFDALLRDQLASFADIAGEVGVPVHYVKLHGTLYHAVERVPELAEVFLRQMQSMQPKLGIFALAGGSFAPLARAAGLRVWEELFADRGYSADGQLMPRGQPGAVIDEVTVAVKRIQRWRERGTMAVDGGPSIPLTGETLCVHSDSPHALTLLASLRRIVGRSR